MNLLGSWPSLRLPKETADSALAVAPKKKKSPKKVKSVKVKSPKSTTKKDDKSSSSLPKGKTEYGEAKRSYREEPLVSTCSQWFLMVSFRQSIDQFL